MDVLDTQEGFKALFNFATEGIIVTDSKAEIVKINPSAESLFGYDTDELLGQKIEVLIPKRFEKSHVKHRNNYHKQPVARAMGRAQNLFAIRKSGEEFPVEISLSPIETIAGKYVIAFVVDISYRIKQENELKKINAELEKTVEDRTLMLREAIDELEKNRQEIYEAFEKEKELNDLKSRFVSMASHEFRTPLSTILSSVSLLSRYNTPETKDKKDKHVKRIKSNVTHLTDILNDLLSLSKLEEGALFSSPECVNIVEFMDELIQDMQALAKSDQQIIYTHEGESNEFYLDAKFLKHIVINLISNAIKFSPDNGSIKVSTIITTDNLTLVVQDNGIGIGKKDQKRLFDRFFRGENVVNIPGTGLGLSIIMKYLELMNGDISFKSELNKGTTFTIKLPNQHK